MIIYLIQSFNEYHGWMGSIDAYISNEDAEERCKELNLNSSGKYYKVETVLLNDTVKISRG